MKTIFARWLCAVLLAGGASGVAQAQADGFPNRALKILVTMLERMGVRASGEEFGPGGLAVHSDGQAEDTALAVAEVEAGVGGAAGVAVGPEGIEVGMGVERLADVLRPPAGIYRLGGDVLFDCDLAAARPAASRPEPS